MRPGGLERESVMTYLDELNSKIFDLEEELKKREEESGAAESGLIQEYRRDLETAEKKAAEAEKKAAEAEQKASESTAQLKSVNDKAVQLASALKAEQEARNSDARKMKQLLQQAQAKSNSVDEGKMREYQQEIVALKGEIGQLTSENSALRSSASSSSQLSETVQKLNEELTAKNKEAAETAQELEDSKAALSEKEKEIEKLKAQVKELEEKASNTTAFAPSFDMSALFAEAQKTASQLTIKAKEDAERTVSEANAQAEKTVNDANAQAEKTVNDANAQAEKTVSDADAQAEKTVNDANEEADRILKEAEAKAASATAEANEILSTAKEKAEIESERIKHDSVEQQQKVQRLTATIKNMLTIEIDGIEKSFREASDLIAQAAKTMEQKVGEADAVIADARECVETNAKVEEETMQDIMSKPIQPAKKSFAQSAMDEIVSKQPAKHTSSASNHSTEKKSGKFAFDMSELIKDAEASVTD
jgi:vacuolar-type H+-ATPase subunit H